MAIKISEDNNIISFAQKFFLPLHGNFQKALEEGNLTTCILIQAILIEAFAISAYHVYIRVADPFAKKITEGCNPNEIEFLNKIQKKQGFFEKFFNFFK